MRKGELSIDVAEAGDMYGTKKKTFGDGRRCKECGSKISIHRQGNYCHLHQKRAYKLCQEYDYNKKTNELQIIISRPKWFMMEDGQRHYDFCVKEWKEIGKRYCHIKHEIKYGNKEYCSLWYNSKRAKKMASKTQRVNVD